MLALFAIAMGAFEAIVVVYLRQMYYPQGFNFPLALFSQQMASVECLREAATVIMLVAVGIIAGKDNLQRFAYFLYIFAIWDIFYYVWLKLLLNWPPSFFTWDLLFLIPVPWIGPVLAPLICSLTMILLAGMIIWLQEKGYTVKIRAFEWGLTIMGSVLITCTFIWDYSGLLIRDAFNSSSGPMTTNEHFRAIISLCRPTHFNWGLFLLGEVLILCALMLVYRRTTLGGLAPKGKGAGH